MSYSIQQIYDFIQREGLQEAIDRISSSDIKDDDLAELFTEAKDIIIRINEHIDNNIGMDSSEDDDDDFDAL